MSKVKDLIEELNDAVEEYDVNLKEMDCGIGSIEYRTDSMQLEQIMEALEGLIKKQGALKVLNLLESAL